MSILPIDGFERYYEGKTIRRRLQPQIGQRVRTFSMNGPFRRMYHKLTPWVCQTFDNKANRSVRWVRVRYTVRRLYHRIAVLSFSPQKKLFSYLLRFVQAARSSKFYKNANDEESTCTLCHENIVQIAKSIWMMNRDSNSHEVKTLSRVARCKLFSAAVQRIW